MEPVPSNFKTPTAVLWIALITAVVVTIIDWKIKQDILRLTDAFYRIYPSTMEEQNAVKQAENRPDNNGHRIADPVLRFHMVDNDAGMETEDAVSPAGNDTEDHSEAWSRFAPELETGLESRTAEDS